MLGLSQLKNFFLPFLWEPVISATFNHLLKYDTEHLFHSLLWFSLKSPTSFPFGFPCRHKTSCLLIALECSQSPKPSSKCAGPGTNKQHLHAGNAQLLVIVKASSDWRSLLLLSVMVISRQHFHCLHKSNTSSDMGPVLTFHPCSVQESLVEGLTVTWSMLLN